MLGIVLGVLASMSWASASFVSARPLRAIPVTQFSLIRFSLVGGVFMVVALLSSGFADVGKSELILLVASGIVGIAFGETLLYKAIKDMGVLKGLIAFSLNIPMTAMLTVSLGDRSATLSLFLGAALTTVAVIVAAVVRTRDAADKTSSGSGVGYAAGLGAAVGQSVGIVLTKAAVADVQSIFAVSGVRALSAAIAMAILIAASRDTFFLRLDRRDGVARDIALSAFLSSGLGLYLANMALQHGDATAVASCLSLSPVFAVIISSAMSRRLPDWQIFFSVVCLCLGLYLLAE